MLHFQNFPIDKTATKNPFSVEINFVDSKVQNETVVIFVLHCHS